MARSRTEVPRSRRRPVLLPTLLTYASRFFSGNFMDGKVRQTRGGVVLPQYLNYYWNRWSRGKRAAVRNGLFWGIGSLTIGLVIQMEYTLLALGYILVYSFGRWHQMLVSRETGGLPSITAPVDGNLPSKIKNVVSPELGDIMNPDELPSWRMERDETAIDEALSAETEDNIASMQSAQRPRRNKREAI